MNIVVWTLKWLCITGSVCWLITSRQLLTVSLLYGLLLAMCGFLVGAVFHQMLRTLPICTGICIALCFFFSLLLNSHMTLLPFTRLCLAFLVLSCVGYAIPFIMCAAICCCFPCLISILRLQEDLGQNRGATQELIGALPTYKFKPKRNKNWGIDHASSSEHLDEGGILGPGTKKERVVSAEDAVSIFHIFLLSYNNILCVIEGFALVIFFRFIISWNISTTTQIKP